MLQFLHWKLKLLQSLAAQSWKMLWSSVTCKKAKNTLQKNALNVKNNREFKHRRFRATNGNQKAIVNVFESFFGHYSNDLESPWTDKKSISESKEEKMPVLSIIHALLRKTDGQ